MGSLELEQTFKIGEEDERKEMRQMRKDLRAKIDKDWT